MVMRRVPAYVATVLLLTGPAGSFAGAQRQDVRPIVRGEGVCDTSGPLGTYTLSWAVINPETSGDITILAATESGAYKGQVYLNPVQLESGASATGSDGPVPGTLSGTVTLTVDYVVNATGARGTSRGSIHLAGDCRASG